MASRNDFLIKQTIQELRMNPIIYVGISCGDLPLVTNLLTVADSFFFNPLTG